jgi:PKHD-type hydroxylase
MSYQSIWYQTEISENLIKIIESDLLEFDNLKKESKLIGDTIDYNKRRSENTWIPENHWISGFFWHYIQKANRENFLYELTCIDDGSLQYTFYNKGQFYDWHSDSNLANYYTPNTFLECLQPPLEHIRKLSAVIQLSDENSYEGGDLEIQDEDLNVYKAPREQGTIIIFDSRSRHRVTKVTKGVRKSIVCWVLGPRWK